MHPKVLSVTTKRSVHKQISMNSIKPPVLGTSSCSFTVAVDSMIEIQMVGLRFLVINGVIDESISQRSIPCISFSRHSNSTCLCWDYLIRSDNIKSWRIIRNTELLQKSYLIDTETKMILTKTVSLKTKYPITFESGFSVDSADFSRDSPVFPTSGGFWCFKYQSQRLCLTVCIYSFFCVPNIFCERLSGHCYF